MIDYDENFKLYISFTIVRDNNWIQIVKEGCFDFAIFDVSYSNTIVLMTSSIESQEAIFLPFS